MTVIGSIPSRSRRLLDDLDRLVERLAEPSAFAAAVVGYYSIALLVRTLVLSGSSGDEAQLMLYGQGMAWFYDLGNPPMAGWLAAAAESALGPSLAVALVVRYGLMALFLVLMHAAAREAFDDRRIAPAVAMSAFGLWFYGWESLRNYMDSLVLITALAATVWLMLRLARTPTRLGYAGLAVAVAVGTLGKFSYPAVLLCLIAAAGVDDGLRRALWSRAGLVAVAVGLAAAMPPYLWASAHLELWLAVADDRLVTSAIADREIAGAVDRGWLVLESALNFTLPLLPLFALVFLPDLVRRGALPIAPARRRVRRWLGVWLLLLWVMATAVVLAVGMSKLREHYMFVLTPLPLLLFAWLPEAVVDPAAHRRRLAAFCGVLGVLALVALAALAGQRVVEAAGCTKCRLIMPWRAFAEQIRAVGFERGTIVSYDSPYTDAGANLRRFLPETRVVSDKRPLVTPAALDRPGGCLVVWNDARYPQVAEQLRAAPVPEIGGPVPAEAVFGRLEAPLVGAASPAPALGYALIEAGAGDCR